MLEMTCPLCWKATVYGLQIVCESCRAARREECRARLIPQRCNYRECRGGLLTGCDVCTALNLGPKSCKDCTKCHWCGDPLHVVEEAAEAARWPSRHP